MGGGLGFLSAVGALGTGAGHGFVQAADKAEQKRRYDEEMRLRQSADARAQAEFEARQAGTQGAGDVASQRLTPFAPIPDPVLPGQPQAGQGGFTQGSSPLGPQSLGQSPQGQSQGQGQGPLGPQSLAGFAGAPTPDRSGGRGAGRDMTPRGSYAAHDKLLEQANTAVERHNAILDDIQKKAAEKFPDNPTLQASYTANAVQARSKELEGLKTDAASKAKQAQETKGISLISTAMANLQRPGGADFDTEVLPYLKAAGVGDAETYRDLKPDPNHPELMWKADGTPIFRYSLTALADPNLSLKEKVAISEKAHQFLDKWKQFEIQLRAQDRQAARQSRDMVLERFKAAYPQTWQEELGFALSGEKRGKADQAAANAEQRRRDKQMGFISKDDQDHDQKVAWINQGYDIHSFPVKTKDGTTQGWIPVQTGEDGRKYADFGVATRGIGFPSGETAVYDKGTWKKIGAPAGPGAGFTQGSGGGRNFDASGNPAKKTNYEGEVSPTGAYVFHNGGWVPNSSKKG